MTEATVNDIVMGESNPVNRTRGLIDGMLDNFIICFDYQGLQLNRDGESLYVSDPSTGKKLGGRLYVDSATVPETMEWLEAKVQLYRGSRC